MANLEAEDVEQVEAEAMVLTGSAVFIPIGDTGVIVQFSTDSSDYHFAMPVHVLRQVAAHFGRVCDGLDDVPEELRH